MNKFVGVNYNENGVDYYSATQTEEAEILTILQMQILITIIAILKIFYQIFLIGIQKVEVIRLLIVKLGRALDTTYQMLNDNIYNNEVQWLITCFNQFLDLKIILII